MVTKSQIKLITGLEQKKSRMSTGLFVVEGIKGINELLTSGFELESLFTLQPIFNAPPSKTHIITEAELKKISRLKTPQTALALFRIPGDAPLVLNDQFTLALDGVRDPGNLGTIIRLCDWFGIKQILCSQDTVDCFNPKVIQATMGSIARVQVKYENLEEVLRGFHLPVTGTFMDGDDIYASQLPREGILVMGNEANGISPQIEKLISGKISIPQFGEGEKAESLNVATATAICLSEYRRQQNY